MADEATDALVPEAPSTEAAAPVEAPAQPDPYEKRYSDLRAEFDRRNSLLDKARNGDVDAIRELGFEYDEPEPDPEPEYEDPYAKEFESTKKELAELKAWRQQQEAERVAHAIASDVERLAGESNLTLSDYDREVIFSRAAGAEQVSPEATKAAFEAHKAYLEGLAEAHADKPHPSRPVTGQAATKDYDPMTATDAERVAYMQARMQGGPVA